jgi:putative hydrolase of the HAD superfamily
MLKAVIFDVGDTLWKLKDLPGDLDAQMAADLSNAGGITPDLSERVVRSAMEAARARAADGTHREPNLAIELGAAARRLGADVDAATIEHVSDIVGNADVARFVANERLARLFEELKASGVSIGVLSNTWTRGVLLRGYLDRLGAGRFVGVGVFSCEEGIRKPHRDIYQRALDGLRVEATEAMFVGDRVREDVLGPQALGMRAVLTHEYRAEDPGDSAPFAIVAKLDGVLELVASINTASGE